MFDITWTMYATGGGPNRPPIAVDQTTGLDDWAEVPKNVIAAVKSICENFFDLDAWENEFGMDACEGDVLLHITAPAEVAGFYEVMLTLAVKATGALKVEDPR